MKNIQFPCIQLKFFIRLSTVSLIALFTLSLPAYAYFHNVKVLRFNSKFELNTFGQYRQKNGQSGLTTSGLVAIDVTENPKQYKNISDFDAGKFKLGQFVVVCFTPSKAMKLRMIDTNPKGRKTKLFPYRKLSIQVAGGVEYCLGDPKSALTLRMGKKSGKGRGILYFVGAPRDGKLPDYNDRPIPKIDATENGTDSNGKLFEAWVIYTVK